jgi:PRTRC genetic system protein C
MQVTQIRRVFHFNSLRLDDPNPAWSPDRVREFFSASFPDLTNAEVAGPDVKDGM